VPRFLISAAPRTGKTTFSRALARELRARNIVVGGFITPDVRTTEGRVGFEIRDFSGRHALIAHAAWITGPQVGRYRVDVNAFNTIAVPAIDQALSTADVVIADEIGQIELCSEAFIGILGKLFSASVPVVATVHAKQHPVTDELKQRSGIELLELPPAGHDEILRRLLAQLVRPARNASTERPPADP
jgi:nucleoside-triphosphatase